MRDVLRVLFHTKGGRTIGFGHLRRCLSLAQMLRHLGVTSLFMVGEERAALDAVAFAGFEAIPVPVESGGAGVAAVSRIRQSQAIVVDSYSVGRDDLLALRADEGVIVVIDDLADRDLPVDLVVNGAVNAERFPYRRLGSTTYLLGAAYALLRPEFAEEPRRNIVDRPRRVLITVGGSDARNLTLQLMRWTEAALPAVELIVIIGPFFDNVEPLKTYAKDRPSRVRLHVEPSDIRSLMIEADLAICGGGQTLYELAATGTPAIAMQTAANQMRNIEGLASAGTMWFAGTAGEPDIGSRITRMLGELASSPKVRAAMCCRGRTVVDGRGAYRVAEAIARRVRVGYRVSDGEA